MQNDKLKLNLGCGYKKNPSYINVDIAEACGPDVIVDLENDLWPWNDNSVDEVVLHHVLEHLGETKKQFFHIMQELYRVCADGAKIKITVPHYNHENFWHDCTHVRAITPVGLEMFSVARNLQTIASGGDESCYGLQIGVDFKVSNVAYKLKDEYGRALQEKQITDEQLQHIFMTQNNVCEAIDIELTVQKK
jgi:hypothetical protein